MKFQDKIIWIIFNLKRSKPPINGLFQKGKENLYGKGNVPFDINIGNNVKLHKLDPLNESYFVRNLTVYTACS